MVKQMINILYIRPLSEKSYGAEEKDLDAGSKILESLPGVNVFKLNINIKTKNAIFDHQINSQNSENQIWKKIRFYAKKMTYFDNALKEAYTFENYLLIERFCIEYNINIIFTNTTCTLLYGTNNSLNLKHIHRSVLFEPIYVFKSVKGALRATIHSMIKIFTVYAELNSDILISISPRDKNYYLVCAKIFRRKKQITYLPLRQFYYDLNVSPLKSLHYPLKIGFLGSTYNVLHNRLSLEFIIKIFDLDFLKENSIVLNIYGRKIPCKGYNNSAVNIMNWVEDLNNIYEENDCFVVPYFLNSGMQSKVFETLMAGRLLICDERVLGKHNFVPGVHFLQAKTGKDFRNRLIWIKEHQSDAVKIAENGKQRANTVIGKTFILEKSNKMLSEIDIP